MWAHDGTGWGSAGKVSVTTVAGIPALPPDAPSGSQFAVFDSTIGEGDLDHYIRIELSGGGNGGGGGSVDYTLISGTAEIRSDINPQFNARRRSHA